LLPAPYAVSAENEGLRKFEQRGVVLEANTALTLPPMKLEVGGVLTGTSESGLTIADHQMVTLGKGVVRGGMLLRRGNHTARHAVSAADASARPICVSLFTVIRQRRLEGRTLVPVRYGAEYDAHPLQPGR
jgi:hypothetical protein